MSFLTKKRCVLTFICFCYLADFSMVKGATLESGQNNQEEFVYIVNSYSFKSLEEGANENDGQAICGTQCNALSVDYQNYLKPGGWRMLKVAGDVPLTIEAGSPFVQGECVCIADKYLIKRNELYMSK